MAITVSVIHQGGDRCHRSWHEDERYENGKYIYNEGRWGELANSLASEVPSAGHCLPADLFLSLREDHLVSKYKPQLIRELVIYSKLRSWGASIYLTADARIGDSPYRADKREELHECLRAALEFGAADVIELAYDQVELKDIPDEILMEGARRSRTRQRVIRDLISAGHWMCNLKRAGTGLANLLWRFDVSQNELKTGRNIVTVLNGNCGGIEVDFSRAATRKYPDAQHALAIHGEISDPLKRFCKRTQIPWIEFRGPLELLFFLLRLESVNPNSEMRLGTVRLVPRQPSPVFTRNLRKGTPTVLVTSTFNKLGDRIDASKDAGLIARAVPPGTFFRIRPNLEGSDLSDLLKSLKQEKAALTVWVFLGHGDNQWGLQSGAAGFLEDAEQWVEHFAAYRRLPVVFFAACQSDVVARAFARAGAGVAIGFKNDVKPEPCQILVERIVKAALNSRGNRDVVLKAYEKGCQDLVAAGYKDAQPIAYCSMEQMI